MAGETQTPNQPVATSPVTPAAPAVLPQPPERQRISTASTRIELEPTQAEKPTPPKGPDGRFVSPATPETPPAAPVTTPAAPPAKPTRPAWLDQTALNLGFTQQEIEGSDTESLGRAVSLAQRHITRSNQQQQAPPSPPPEPVVNLGLTKEQEEAFGPDAMAVFNKLAMENAKNKQEFEARLAQFEQREQVRSQSQMINTLESAVSALGDGFEGVLGKGTLADLMKTDPASYERRHFVLTSLQRQGLDYLSAPVDVIREQIRRKTEELFPGMVKAAPPANPAEMEKPLVSKDVWNKAGSPPPTQRTGGNEPPPRQGGDIEDRHRGAITEEEIADEKIMGSLRRRTQERQGLLANTH